MAREHCDIAQVSAVASVCENPARRNQLLVLKREAAKHAVGENKP
jgi:hypothetical protein